jgi:hypothetical protein
MRQRLSEKRSAGSESGSVASLARIAAALRIAKRFEEGLRTIDEAFLINERTGDRMLEAEVLRVKGELLLGQDESNAEQILPHRE